MESPLIALDDPRLYLIGRCVDCRKNILELRGVHFTCESYERTYQFDEAGILRAFPQQPSNTPPYIYNTTGYQLWLNAWKVTIGDWNPYLKKHYHKKHQNQEGSKK